MIKHLGTLDKNQLAGRKVLLRVDFNVPVPILPCLLAPPPPILSGRDRVSETGSMSGPGRPVPILPLALKPNSEGRPCLAEIENFRIKAHRPTLDYLVESGAKVMLVSHFSAVDSFGSIVEGISGILGKTITLVPLAELNLVTSLFNRDFNRGPLLLLDNIRQDPREEKNDPALAEELAAGFDLYVNDAFSVSHRRHASVAAITKYLPACAGFLMKKEIDGLTQAIKAPSQGKVLVIGGAKISTKEPVIKNFLDKAERILVGGAVANDFFDAQGIDVGDSVVDDTITPNWDFLTSQVGKLVLPEDVLVAGDLSGATGVSARPVGDVGVGEVIVDIGPESAKKFAEIISQAAMVIWNGPLGLVETDAFADGTKIIAQAVASAKHSVIGGGDTIAFVDRMGLLDKYSFVSTGGGAMLEFLAGRKMPGLEALGYY